MHTRPFCTLYPSFSPNWTVHISPTRTQKLYLTRYQTRYVLPFLHILKKQQTKYSNVFPVTAYQQAPKLHPKCTYKETYHLLIKKGQQAVTKLFGHLQDAHNHMSEVAKAVVDVSEVSSPEQFTFVLQLAVRPIIQLKIPPHLSAPTELKFDKERLTPEEITEENCCNLILPQPFHPKFSTIAFKHLTRCLAAAAHFLIRKKLFNTKYPQLLVAKDFAVAEKKLRLTVSRSKYDPGKKAPRKRRTPDVKTADPKSSTSQDQPQDKSISEQQPQDKSISEQQPQDKSVSEQQPQDESISEQPQGTSASEQQPQGKASTSTLQELVLSQFSDDDETLPDPWTMARKAFATKDPRSIPKKPRYSLRLKTDYI